MISVIITNYNYGRFLSACIASVLSQTYQDLELLVVDDGSTDNSRDVLASIQDARLKVLLQDNGGQASAFNAGFAASSGEIVCFLDSDDWWESTKLERVAAWHNLLGGRYGLMQHGLTVWHNGPTGPYRNTRSTGDCFSEMRATGNLDYFMPTSALVFTRNVLQNILPMPNRIRICSDAYLMRTSCAFGPVVTIPENLGYYRQHQNTVFKNAKFDTTAFFREIIIPSLNDYYSQHGLNLTIKLPPAPKPPGILHGFRRFFHHLRSKREH